MAGQSLNELVDSITVEAYGVDEQLTAFFTVFDEEVSLPCAAQILDVDIDVLAFDLEGDERRGVVARCRRPGGTTGVVSLVDVSFEPGTLEAWLHAAFRSWLGLKTFPARLDEGRRGDAPAGPHHQHRRVDGQAGRTRCRSRDRRQRRPVRYPSLGRAGAHRHSRSTSKGQVRPGEVSLADVARFNRSGPVELLDLVKAGVLEQVPARSEVTEASLRAWTTASR